MNQLKTGEKYDIPASIWHLSLPKSLALQSLWNPGRTGFMGNMFERKDLMFPQRMGTSELPKGN
jgi:hypothetical protein